MMIKYSEDKELVTLLRNSDEGAFRIVFDRYHRRVYQFAYSFLKDQEQSEDVVQETFLNFWIYRIKLSIDIPIAPLLFTITRRIIINQWKKCSNSDKFRQKLIHTLRQSENNTEDHVVSQDLERISNAAFVLLTEQQREVFILSREEGLTYNEIAERLQISPNTVKYHLTNALNIFRHHFAKHGVLYTNFFLFYFADL